MDAMGEIVGGESADRHERRAAQRDLAGIAGQEIEAERGKAQGEERDEDRLEEIA